MRTVRLYKAICIVFFFFSNSCHAGSGDGIAPVAYYQTLSDRLSWDYTNLEIRFLEKIKLLATDAGWESDQVYIPHPSFFAPSRLYVIDVSGDYMPLARLHRDSEGDVVFLNITPVRYFAEVWAARYKPGWVGVARVQYFDRGIFRTNQTDSDLDKILEKYPFIGGFIDGMPDGFQGHLIFGFDQFKQCYIKLLEYLPDFLLYRLSEDKLLKSDFSQKSKQLQWLLDKNSDNSCMSN